ncbi:MAG: diacylglycerol/lipid kinase family protein [Opitutales bacterium]
MPALFYSPSTTDQVDLEEIRHRLGDAMQSEVTLHGLHDLDGWEPDATTARVFAMGGDGTVHAVASRLAQVAVAQRPTLAPIPLGTGNDFARALGYRLEDFEAGFALATGDSVARVDLGRWGERAFVNAITLGFGAEATRDNPETLKDVAKGFSYALLTAWKAIAAEPFELTVEMEEETWEGSVIAACVLNGGYIGGGFPAGFDARLADGKLDLAIVPAVALEDVPAVIEDWKTRDRRSFQHIVYRQLRAAELRCSRPVAASLDGEVDELERCPLRVESAALEVTADPGAEQALV